MKLVLLGTAGYHPNDRRQTACFMIPELGIVLDAGTGMYRVRDRLVTSHLDIFLTHAHLDHVCGLTFLLDVLHGKTIERVTVHGEAHKLSQIKQHLFSEALFPVQPRFELRPLSAEVALTGKGRLKHFPLEHPGGSIGYRLDWPGHSLAYVTDTTAADEASYQEHIHGVDLLIHECNFPDAMLELANLTGHSCTTAVAETAHRAGVKQLVLVHFNALDTSDDPIGLPVARAIFPATQLGEDGMEIDF